MVLEISLVKLGISESGRLEPSKPGNNLLSCTLLYPAAGKPSSTTVKAFKLKDDQTIDFGGTNPDTGRPFTYGDTILLKEDVHGDTELIVEVTDVEQPSTLDKVLTGLIGAVFKGAWAVASGGVTNLILGAVLEAASGAHLNSMKLDGAKVRVVGRASVSINAATQQGEHDIRLDVPEDLELTQVVLKPGGASGFDIRKVKLAKGTPNGRLILRFRAIQV